MSVTYVIIVGVKFLGIIFRGKFYVTFWKREI